MARKEIIELEVSGADHNLLVEAVVTAGEGKEERISNLSNKETLEKCIGQITPILNQIIAPLRQVRPDELEIELGFGITTEAGVILTKGSTEANLKVTLSWKKTAESK